MTWGKVSDDLHSHPKWTGASPNAKALWVTALSYCSGYLTDGKVSATDHLPTLAVETFGFVPSSMRKATAAAKELEQRGLWRSTAGGWKFHDWRDNNPSASQVRQRKKKDKRREWLHKTTEGKELKRVVRERDGDLCSWCGGPVRWGANRAPDGGTYEHIREDGPDTVDNIVVAHNSCNGTKSDRDHEDLGWSLRPGHALVALYDRSLRVVPGHSPDPSPSASTRPDRDSVATESSRVTHPGAGRVGFGSGLDGDGSPTGTPCPVESEFVPPPDDSHYPYTAGEEAS